MKEEERRKRLQEIEKARKDMRVLKQKRSLLYQLKKEALVKLYIRLELELSGKEILTVDEIKKREMGRTPEVGKCNHDIWYCYRDYSKKTVKEDIDYYVYNCLDCYEECRVPKDENEVFLKEHTVIETSIGFQKCRNLYTHLLCTNHVDTAYEKLLKKVKKFEVEPKD